MNNSNIPQAQEDLKSQALFYTQRLGLKVIPLRPGSKIPVYSGWTTPGHGNAPSDDYNKIFSWWNENPAYNIGIPTGGINGIVVLDIDNGPGKNGSDTIREWFNKYGSWGEVPTVKTPTGGLHFYFKHPGFPVKNHVGQLAPHIDIRSDGGQVVAPGSVRKEGVYTWAKDLSIGQLAPPEMPEWLIKMIKSINTKKEGKRTGGDNLEGTGRVWGEYLSGGPIENGRDDYLFRKVACHMRTKGAGFHDVRATVEAVYRARCTDFNTKGDYEPFGDKEFTRIANSAMKYEPGAEEEQEQVKRRPKIQTNYRHERDIINDAWDSIIAANKPPRLFQRERILMELRDNELERVSEMSLRGILSGVADWVSIRMNKDKVIEVPARVPDFSYKVMPHRIDERIPEVKGLVYSPIFAPDGSLNLGEGYNQKSKLYYSNLDKMKVPEVSEKPTGEEVQEAIDLLINNLFIDFPFKDNASRVNALATLLYLFARELVDDIAPLHLIDAPTAGTGKTFLAKAIYAVATGMPAPMDALPKKEEETEKKILSILMGGRPVVVLDNATGKIESESMNRILTSKKYSGRVLGESRVIEVNNNALWLMTGNNVNVEGDIHRRIMWIRLDAKMERAYQRKDWVHEDLLGWIKECRAALVWSCLVLIQNWIAQGRPTGSKTMASYERWARTMSGILEASGIDGFLDNREELIERANDGNDNWFNFFSAWWGKYQDAPVKGKDIFKLADGCDFMFDYLGDGGENSRKSKFTRELKKQRDVLHGLYVVRVQRDRVRNLNQYQLVKVEE